MHKGDYHTDYSKYYDKEYKEKDLAFEHVKKLKQGLRTVKDRKENQTLCEKESSEEQKQSFKNDEKQEPQMEVKPTVKKRFHSNEWKEKK